MASMDNRTLGPPHTPPTPKVNNPREMDALAEQYNDGVSARKGES
jgi:hypothetical protein